MSDPVDSELINKITELQQEAKEHMYVLPIRHPPMNSVYQARTGCI